MSDKHPAMEAVERCLAAARVLPSTLSFARELDDERARYKTALEQIAGIPSCLLDNGVTAFDMREIAEKALGES